MDNLSLVFQFGSGGWVKAFWRRGGPEEHVFVRFEPVSRRRTKKKKTWWRLAELRVKAPTAERLREIPLYRIETAFNALEMSEELWDRLDDDVPADLDKAMLKLYENQVRPPLKRPATRRLDDDFFREVGWAYRRIVAAGGNPVMTIATEADVPHSTVARWIAQTRERGFLPPSQRGKVAV